MFIVQYEHCWPWICILEGLKMIQKRIETCRPKITFYVIKLLCLIDTLQYV